MMVLSDVHLSSVNHFGSDNHHHLPGLSTSLGDSREFSQRHPHIFSLKLRFLLLIIGHVNCMAASLF